MHTIARTLFFGTLAWLAFGLPGRFLPEVRGADAVPDGRLVYLARDLTDEGLITLGAAVGAHDPRARRRNSSAPCTPGRPTSSFAPPNRATCCSRPPAWQGPSTPRCS